MSYPLPLTRTEAYLAYKAGVIQQSELKPSLSVPRIGIDAWLAYWTELTNEYPKNPDGTPKMLQEEEEYIAYLCGVTDTYPEECLRRVGAYLRYLISARWGRPDHPLNREELYLSLIKTQVVPSGDPSSDIVIDGTAKAPFVEVKLYGDTFQQSYEGKNLVDTFSMTEGTASGLTTTKSSDGAIIINGTQSGVYNLRLDMTDYFSERVGEDFTISVLASGVGRWSNFGFKTPSSAIVPTVTPTTPTRTVTLTQSSSGQYWADLYISNDGTVFTDYKIYIQIEAGSTATAYEPYVGGTPSPNPDYPQPIKTVTGRQVVNVTGKNLYRSNNQTTAWDGATITTDGSEITFTGNAGGNSAMPYIRQEIPISIPSGTTLTVSAKTVSGKAWGSGVLRCGVRLYYSDGTNSNLYIPDYYPGNFGTTKSTTITTSKDVIGMAPAGLSYSAKGIIDPVTFVCQLEKGSTATAYEPYSSNDYEINLGKNLFSSRIVQGYYAFANGNYSPNSSSYVTSEDKIPVEAGQTYTISANKGVYEGSDYTGAGVVFFNNGTYVSSILRPENGTFTVPAGANQVIYNFYKGSSDSSITPNDITWVQLELGSTATTYAPYFEPIELCKLGDYQDYIYKDGEDWKVHKKITKYVCDSTLNWTWDASVPRLSANSATLGLHVIGPINADTAVIGKSNKFVANSFNYVCTQKNNGFAYSPSGFISCVDKEWGSESEAKADILGSIFYFVLQDGYTTDITITETNLIAQLEALVAGGAENGTTYIKVDATDPNLPGLLYVEAPKYE